MVQSSGLGSIIEKRCDVMRSFDSRVASLLCGLACYHDCLKWCEFSGSDFKIQSRELEN